MTNFSKPLKIEYLIMASSKAVSAGVKHNRSLKVVFSITASYLIIEVVVGFISNSLALLSDAAHMLTDEYLQI